MMIKKNVVIYVSGFYYGGIEEFVTNVVSNIAKDRFNITVLTRYADSTSKAYEKIISTGVNVYSLGIMHLSIGTFYEFYKKLDNFFKKNSVDFLHVNGLDEPFLLQIAKLYGIKTAIHVHEPYGESSNFAKNMLKSFIRSSNLKNINEYFACSEDTGKIVYAPHGISQFTVIANGVENRKFAFDDCVRMQIRNELKLEGITIGHVGRFTDVKNQEFILEVFNRLLKRNRNYKLVLVGDGEDRVKIEKQIAAYGIDNQVLLLGERNDVHRVLQAFDVFIMPSKFEGLGMSLIEAQSSGLRCIVSDRIPGEAVITDLVIQLPLETNAGVWADAIEHVSLTHNRAAYSNEVGKTKFDIGYTCRQLEAIYAKY